MGQLDFQCLVVNCFYCNIVWCFSVAVQCFTKVYDNTIKQPAVCRSCCRICHQFQGVLKVICCQRYTIAPFCIFTDMESIGHTIFTDIPVFSHTRNSFGCVAFYCIISYQRIADHVVSCVIRCSCVSDWIQTNNYTVGAHVEHLFCSTVCAGCSFTASTFTCGCFSAAATCQ